MSRSGRSLSPHRNAFLLMSAELVSRGGGILASILCIRLLSVSEYGLIAVGLSLGAILHLVTDGGLGALLVTYGATRAAADHERLLARIRRLRGTLLLGGMMVMWLVDRSGIDLFASGLSLLLAGIVASRSLVMVGPTIQIGLGRSLPSLLVGVAERGVLVGGILLLAVLAQVSARSVGIAYLLSIGVAFLLAERLWRTRPDLDVPHPAVSSPDARRSAIAFLWATSLCTSVYLSGPVVIIQAFQSPSAAAILGAYLSLYGGVVALLTLLVRAYIPSLVAGPDRGWHLMALSMVGVSAFPSVVLYMGSVPLTTHLFGAAYGADHLSLRLLMVGAIPSALTGVTSARLLMRRRESILLVAGLLSALTFLLGSGTLAQGVSVWSLARGIVLAECVQLLVTGSALLFDRLPTTQISGGAPPGASGPLLHDTSGH